MVKKQLWRIWQCGISIAREEERSSAVTLKLAVEQLCIGQLTMGRWRLLINFLNREQVGQYVVLSGSLMGQNMYTTFHLVYWADLSDISIKGINRLYFCEFKKHPIASKRICCIAITNQNSRNHSNCCYGYTMSYSFTFFKDYLAVLALNWSKPRCVESR